MTHQGSSDSRGFTRVDLMACVAATVVLAALGASALSGNKDNVSRIICASNLRQLGLAEGMYACDNADYLPYCNWDGGSGPDPSPGWLYTLPVPLKLPGAGSEKLPDPFLYPWRPNPSGAWESGVWWPYVRNSSAYLCPVDIQSADYKAEPQGANGPGRNNKLSSYQMNGASCNFGSTTPVVSKISDVWSPGCYLLWEVDENVEGPGNPGAFAYNDGGTYPTVPPNGTGGLGVLHCNNGGEVLTVGGAVNFVTLSYFTAQAGYGPSLTWWAPHLANGGF